MVIRRKLWTVILAGVLTACGGGSSDNDDDGDADNDGDGLEIDNELAGGVPSDLAIASPTAQGTEADADDLATLVLETDSKSREARLAAIQAILNGDEADDCKVELEQPNTNAGSDFCYGPSIDYNNHPDGAPTSGSLPGGDLGIWEATAADDSACMASKLNTEVERVGGLYEVAAKAQAIMLCAGKVHGEIEVPTTTDDAADFLASIEEIVSASDTGVTFETATMTVEAVDGEGDEATFQYLTNLKFTFTDGPTLEIGVRHKQNAADNSTYVGKIWIKNTPDDDSESLQLATVLYERSSSDTIVYEYMYREDDSDTKESEQFDDNNIVYAEDLSSGFYWGVHEIDGDSEKLAFSWIAGNENENTRSFIASTEGDLGSKTGTAYFGYGPAFSESFANTDNPIEDWIDRMICNWAGPSNDHTGTTLVQRQKVEQNDEGVFQPTESSIGYAPANDCNGDGTFEWRDSMDGGAYTAFDNGNDLITIGDLSDGALDSPTRPTDVDD